MMKTKVAAALLALTAGAVGSGDSYSDHTYAANSSGVQALRVQSCRVGTAPPTVCSSSQWESNPFY